MWLGFRCWELFIHDVYTASHTACPTDGTFLLRFVGAKHQEVLVAYEPDNLGVDSWH